MKHISILIIFSLFLASCAPATTPPPTVDVGAIQTAAVQAAHANATKTAAAAPTETPLPTDTPLPTETPAPTATPTPKPQPLTFTGTGNQVIDVQKWAGPALIRGTYDGGSNFIVYNYDADNNKIGLIVNGLYTYHGTKLIDTDKSEETKRLEVKTEGAWKIELLPMPSTTQFEPPGSYSGVDDDVILLTGAQPDLLKYKAGDSNFIVYGHNSTDLDERDLIVNEIGPIEGSTILAPHTFLLEISGTGKWTIEITTK